MNNTAFSLQIPLTPLQPPSERPTSPAPNVSEGPATSLPSGLCAGQREVGGADTGFVSYWLKAPPRVLRDRLLLLQAPVQDGSVSPQLSVSYQEKQAPYLPPSTPHPPVMACTRMCKVVQQESPHRLADLAFCAGHQLCRTPRSGSYFMGLNNHCLISQLTR